MKRKPKFLFYDTKMESKRETEEGQEADTP
jgi:hypothetical protein